jgi:alkylated DNA repair protein alkB family protein 1
MLIVGCVLLPNYLTSQGQLRLAEEALSTYTLPPNPLSLSTHYDLPPNLFELYANESAQLIHPLHSLRRPQTPTTPVSSTGSTHSTGSTRSTGSGRSTIETEPNAVVEFEDILAKNQTVQIDEPSENLKPKSARGLMKEIRWANLGWVYQVRLPELLVILADARSVVDQGV